MSEPWYQTFDSAFWLTLSASVLAFLGVCLQAILKSRCKQFNCCGMSCIRDPAPPGQEPEIDISVLERGRAGSLQSHPTTSVNKN
jgi:hypothetical protein